MGKTNTPRINKKRRERYRSSQERRQASKAHGRFRGKERGGLQPNGPEINYHEETYLKVLQDLVEEKSHIFIDTNSLEPRAKGNRAMIFNGYLNIAAYAGYRDFFDKADKFTEKMLRYIEGLSRILERENVHITDGVKEEIRAYTNFAKRDAKEHIASKARRKDFCAPINALDEAIHRNNARLEELGLQENPLVEAVYSILPDKLENNCKYSPSHTDKNLIAVPFAEGLTSGETIGIITNDHDIRDCLLWLRTNLRAHPERLPLNGVGAETLQPFEISVRGIYLTPKVKVKSAIFTTRDFVEGLKEHHSATSLHPTTHQ